MISAWAPVLAWMAAVGAASLTPVAGVALDVPMGIDTWAHVALYAVLGALVARAVRRSGGSIGAAWAAALALAAAYGAGMEGAQSSVGRDPSVGDWLADVVGGGLGAAVFVILSRPSRAEEAG